MRSRRAAGAATALLLGIALAACGSPEVVEAPTDAEPAVSTDAATTAAPSPSTTEPAEPEPEPEPAVLGPQTCGTVTSTIGEPVAVEILAGEVDCAFAEDLLDTYYNDPPSAPEGSGGYVTIGDWECNSSSSQEPGRASTCHGPGEALIVTLPTAATGTPGPVCSQIDQPTLEQIFPEGRYDEDRCQSYIDGENSAG